MLDQVMQTPQPAPEQSDTPNTGSIDAAALAFVKRDPDPAPTEQDQPEVTDQPEDADPNAEAESQPDEDTSEDEEEVEIEGLKFSVPKAKAEEIRKATLRQADYSRKMNEVSAKEKLYTQRIEQAEKLAAGASEFSGVLAEALMLDERIKHLEGMNWAQLRQDNPGEYAAYAADLQTVRMARSGIDGRAAQVSRRLDDARQQALAEKRDAMFGEVAKSLKGWDDEMGKQITQYAVSNGVAFETLSTLTDAGVVVALEKARKYDALQASKDALKAKAKVVPQVLRPGAPKQTNPQTDAMARLRKSSSVDDAAAAFLARMR